MSRAHRAMLRACGWVCAAALLASTGALAEPAPASPELDRKFTELAARRSPPRGALAKVTSALIAERVARAQAFASMNRWTEAHGSPYLALDAITPRTLPSMDGRRSAGPYRIEVRIGDARLSREPAERAVRRDAAMLDYPGGMMMPITVSYGEFVEPVSATVSATVSSSGAPTAGAMASLHAVGEGRASARWTGAILGTDSSTAWSSQHTQIVCGPGGDPSARRRAEAARQDAIRRATTLAHESLAEALAERILNDLDREPNLAAPTIADLAPHGWTPAP
ncbi:MAG: hypothetical protein ACI8PZ_001044 [Myxococcota bacterium]|jgi:hypothetical protein